MEYLKALTQHLTLFLDVFIQRVKCWGLGSIDEMCSSALNRTIVITGPTSGIGKAAAICLAKKGANVILACRSIDRGEALKGEIQHLMKNEATNVEVWKLDVASPTSVREFVMRWKSTGRSLHILINNAGVYNMAGPRKTVPPGIEDHLATNFLGPFLLTIGLLPSLFAGGKESGDARIVNVSSLMHILGNFNRTNPMLDGPGIYTPQAAYTQSKLALTAFSVELRRRIPAESNVMVCSLHPGAVITNVARTLPGFVLWVYKNLFTFFLLNTDEGARSIVYCATNSKVPELATKSYGYFDSNCATVVPSPKALCEEFGRWVWSWAAEMTNLPGDGIIPSTIDS